MTRILTFLLLGTLSVLIAQEATGPDTDEVERDLLAAMKSATTERERKILGYIWRYGEIQKKHEDVDAFFSAKDGIDEFEAYALAQTYFEWYVSGCGFIELPEKKGSLWVVPILVGRGVKPGPPIIIDSKNGFLRCDGYSDLSDPEGFLREPKQYRMKNK